MTEAPLAPLSERLKRANVAAMHFDRWPECPITVAMQGIARQLCDAFAEQGYTVDPGEITHHPHDEKFDPTSEDYSPWGYLCLQFDAWSPCVGVPGDLPDISRYPCGLYMVYFPEGVLQPDGAGRILTNCPFIVALDQNNPGHFGFPIEPFPSHI